MNPIALAMAQGSLYGVCLIEGLAMMERERGSIRDAVEATLADDKGASPNTRSPAAPVTAADDEDARHERFMEIARNVMRDHRNVLAALAK